VINRLKNSWFAFALFLGVSCLVYFPVLGSKARNPDAGLILPSLFDLKNPFEYFSMLANFQVMDFQPVRDLTFFFDIAVFKLTGIVSFATTNVFLWALAMLLFFRLLERVVPQNKKTGVIIWALAFTVYPLFSQVIPWGMARKHILAFLLILWATHKFLDWMEGKGSFFRPYIVYVLAALSHPITILWPIWAFIHFWLFSGEEKKAERKRFIIYLFTALALLFTNYAYYTVGNQKVSDAFGNVKPDYFNLGKNVLNFSFYFRQLVWPYQLGFLNYPEFSNSWPGMVAFLLLVAFVIIHRKEKNTYSWVLFALFPFPIFISLPAVFDQYLLIPAAGLVLLFAHCFHRPAPKLVAAFSVMIIAWGALTFNESTYWVNLNKIADRNFENSPSCKSAAEVLLSHYKEKEKAPPHVLDFFVKGNCFAFNANVPINMKISYVYIEAMMLFYETDAFSHEERVERLQNLALFNYYPDLVLAALYSKEGNNSAIEEISRKIIEKTGNMKLETGPVIDDVLRPYCEKEKLEACLQITVPNLVQLPYL
jgi:hypothetical protein